MNDRDEQVKEIERDEAWLQNHPTPAPDPLVIDRVKYVVGAACKECHDEAPAARSAMAAAKAAVRRELSTQHVARRSVWRLVTPMLATAAAVAFGVFRLAMNQPQALAMDPTFTAFVEVMSESPSELDLSLSELDRDVDDLSDDGFVMTHTDWTTDWIDAVGENLDFLSDEFSQLEQMQ